MAVKRLIASSLASSLIVFLFAALPAHCSGPETIDEAVAMVNAVRDPDSRTQTLLRCKEAQRIVHERITILNGAWGTFLQTIPIDVWNKFSETGSYKDRDEALAALRNMKGIDGAQAAWILKAGHCAEHATLVKTILERAGMKVVVVTSTAPHDFPVVNPAQGFDPDIPFTWGDNFVVPDSWTDGTIAGGLDGQVALWNGGHYFNGGSCYCFVTARTTTRETLAHFVEKGKEYTEQRCPMYKSLVDKYNKIPPEYRQADYPPKWCTDDEQVAGVERVLGTWQSDWGPVTLEGSKQSEPFGLAGTPSPATPGGSEQSITGSWNQNGNIGQIKSGTFNSATGILKFNYYQNWNNQEGVAELTLSADGKTLSGTWKQGAAGSGQVDGGGGSWTLTRSGEVSAPSRAP